MLIFFGIRCDILCSFISFRGKTTYYVACTKKAKNILYVVVLQPQNLSFAGATFFFRKLVYQHKMSRYTCKILV